MTIAISPIPICCRWISTRPGSTKLKAGLPELPDAKKARFIKDFGLSAYDAGVLVAEKETAGFYEEVARGPRCQARRQLGDLRTVRRAQQGGLDDHRARRSRRPISASWSI